MEDELMNDELPSPPMGAAAEGEVSVEIDDQLDASLLADVPKMGEAIPVGTYMFRMDSFKQKMTTKDYKTNLELAPHEQQPYFELHWKCQQEPYVGRVVFENVPWVRQEDVRDAGNPESPRRGEAKKKINDRLPRAKEIMEAAGFTPTGKFGFKEFLGTNPELKLQLKLKEKQQKGSDGKWKDTGEFVNEVQKHVSAHRPM